MQSTDRKKGKDAQTAESPETLDRRISDIEQALAQRRAFLEQLTNADDEVHQRVKEIAFSYERELDRLRSKKKASGQH